jgi:1-acyl-sn-glycerol-3-phosphate acyltransferase
MNHWHHLWKSVCWLYIAALTQGVHVEGREHIRPGPKIIISNHPTVSAMFALPFVFSARLCYLIQSDVFDLPIVGRAMRGAGHFPALRGQRQATLEAAHEKLRQGHSVVIYPEGILSPVGGFAPPRVGAALLALESGAPIVPVGCHVPPRFIRRFHFGLQGRERNGVLHFGGKCFVRIGPAWHPPEPAKADRSETGLRHLAGALMERVIQLTRMAERTAAAAES